MKRLVLVLVPCLVAMARSFLLFTQGARILLGTDHDDSERFVIGATLSSVAILMLSGIGAGSIFV